MFKHKTSNTTRPSGVPSSHTDDDSPKVQSPNNPFTQPSRQPLIPCASFHDIC